MNLNLKNHQIWQEFTEILAKINVNALASEHLEDCHYTINGYWDENEFYQQITFGSSVSAELVSSSLGIIVGEPDNSHWLKFKFLLLTDISADSGKLVSDVEKRIGEVILIFDSNLEFVDENWLINVKSPFVVAKCAQDLNTSKASGMALTVSGDSTQSGASIKQHMNEGSDIQKWRFESQ